MAQRNKVVVKINGQEYSIVGAEAKEYLLKVGSFVDEKMETVAKANKKLSTSMIAVLTSINIADQYFKTRSDLEKLEDQLKEPEQIISELEKHVEGLHNELEEKDQAYLELEEKLRQIEDNQEVDEQVALLGEKLLQKEEDLEKAQGLINDLRNKLLDNQLQLVQLTNELDECKKKKIGND